MERIVQRMWPQTVAQKLKLAQWFIPVLLFGVAAGFEIIEHILREGDGATFNFNAEIVIFGVVGPIIVWWVLGWV